MTAHISCHKVLVNKKDFFYYIYITEKKSVSNGRLAGGRQYDSIAKRDYGLAVTAPASLAEL